MGRIITYNLGDNFITKLAGYIDENYLRSGRDLGRLAVVFGGRRPALFLKKELSVRIGGVFFPPRFFTIDDFVDDLLGRAGSFRSMSDLDACYDIYELARKETPEVLVERHTFAQFLPWAREILSFIEQLDLEDVRSVKLQNIQLKAQIGYDVPESINRLLSGIIRLRAGFHERMRTQRAYSRGYRYLQASLLAGQIELAEFDEVLFAGFFYLHATERALIKQFHERGQGTVIFQGACDEWSVLKENVRAFGAEPVCASAPSEKACVTSIVAGYDLHAQAGLVRQAYSGLKHKESTVIVLPVVEHIIPLVSEVSCVCDDFNVSMGYPLSRSAVYSLFRIIFKAQETRKLEAYYTRDYMGALSHPLVKSIRFFQDPALTRILVHKIEEILSGREDTPIGGSSFIRLDEIEEAADVYDLFMDTVKKMGLEVSRDEVKSALRKLHEVLFGFWSEIRNFNEFAGRLEEFMDLVARKSSLGRFPLNVTMAERLLKLSAEFRSAAFSAEEFPAQEIFKIFRDTMEHATIQFKGSPLKGAQILGVLETRSLSFDNVIIMDVNESAVPALTIYEPLIPREVMIHLGLNRLEKEEEIQRYQFRRLIAAARQVTLVYQNSPDKEKSRFIEELVWERQKETGSLSGSVIPQGTFSVKVIPERLRLPKDQGTLEYLRGLEYSASSINTYLDCSLRFYYQYVLGLQEKEDLLDEPEGADIGTFMHNLLEEAFRPFVGRAPKIDEEFIRGFRRSRDARFEQEFSRKMRSDAFLLKGVIDVRLEQFLENERIRPVRRIIGLEKKLKGVLRLESGEFRVQARIDRIDQLAHEVMIIDYKTGVADQLPHADLSRLQALSLDRNSIKRTVRSFQLPLYVYLAAAQGIAPADTINAGLYSLRDMSDDFGIRVLFRKEEQRAGKEGIMACYLKALDALFRELLDPAVPFQAQEEDEHACRYCPFFYLCR